VRISLSRRAYSNIYYSKLLKQIEILKKKPAFPVTKAPTSLKQTTFSSLSLRLNEPYWLIHKGNCEHFIVIDQIRYVVPMHNFLSVRYNIFNRLLHPSDAKFGYPLTLHITPSLLDLCRACAKVPAVWSIVGDVRLGENPCVMCDPCWEHMGESKEEGVVALPLPNPKLAIV
jgi:snRNA-activating protein complex subunit 3